MNEIATTFLKTYQVWHHRRLLLTALNSVDAAARELEFLKTVLRADAKNYHTWSFRQWILAHFNDEERLWAGERAYIEELLEQDVRNNSAWHHRFFVVFSSGVRLGDEDRDQVLRRELSCVPPYRRLTLRSRSASFVISALRRRRSLWLRTTRPHGTISEALSSTRICPFPQSRPLSSRTQLLSRLHAK